METIGHIEGKCRDALERLHPPLRRRVEGKRFLPAWGDFTRNEKIGIIAIAVAVAVPVVIALASGP
jgi:hypothetical protein